MWSTLNPSAEPSEPTPPATQTKKWVPRDPSEWRGTPYDVKKKALHKFPCIGASCLAHGRWHEAGTIELALQAEKGIHRQSAAQWQHLCESCADAGEHQRWAPAAAGSSSGAAASPAPAPADDPMGDDADDDDAVEAAVAAAEQMQEILRAGGEDDSNGVFNGLCATRGSGRDGGQPQPPAQPVQQLPPQPPKARYFTHGSKDDVGEVKQLLGKGLWDEISPKLPRVQRDGSLERPEHPSRAASTGSTVALVNEFEGAFPHAPLYHPPRAEIRALKCKQGADWTSRDRAVAMGCFAAEAAGMTPVLFMHELVGRTELEADERFRAPGGCLCICPSCESNAYVKPDGVNASKARDLRFAWGEGCCYEAIYSQYICFGPACPAVLAKHEDKPQKLVELQSFVEDGVFLRRGGPNPPDALGVRFSGLDPQLTERLLPEALRARYHVSFFAGRTGGLDVSLAARLFRSREDMREMATSLSMGRAAIEVALARRYLAFAAAQMRASEQRAPTAMEAFAGVNAAPRGPPALWPDYRFHHPTDSPLHLSHTNVTTAIKGLHEQIRPWLTGDILRRAPGEFASSDGTFRLAMRTIGDGTNVIFFILGERGDVVGWYVLSVESWAELYPALLRLRARLKRMKLPDGSTMLDKLKYWYDDRCCNGCSDDKVYNHVLVYLFHGISRCPYRDGFHAVQTCTKTLHDGTQEGKKEYSAEIGHIIYQQCEKNVEQAAAHIIKKHPSTGEISAITEARTTYARDGIIRTFGATSSALAIVWKECIEKWRSRKQKAREEHVQICIRSETQQKTGTIEQMETILECINKGCLTDPLPVDQMYFDLKRQPITGLMERRKKGATGKNESMHGTFNELVEHVARMSEEVMVPRLEFAIFLRDEHIDTKFGLRDAHAHGGYSWVMSVLNMMSVGVLESAPYPSLAESYDTPFRLPPLVPIDETHEHYEPMGFDYPKEKKNEADRRIVERVIAEKGKVDEALAAAARAQATAAARAQAAAEAEEVAAEGQPTDAALAILPAGPATGVGSPSRSPHKGKNKAAAEADGSGSGRQGGVRWSGAHKVLSPTAASLPPIVPTSQAELDLMTTSYTAAQQEYGAGNTTSSMYRRAEHLYLEGVTRAHLGSGDPPVGLRNNRTSGAIIKRLIEDSLKRSRAIESERGDHSAPGIIDDATISANVPASGADASAATVTVDEAADAEQLARKVQRVAEKAAKDSAADQVRHKLIIEDRRPLTLAELSTAHRELTQKVLRLYCSAMGEPMWGSPALLRTRLEARMKAANVSEYCAGDALGSGD